MKLDAVGIAAAHFGNFLTLTHGLVFFDQECLVVGVSREVGVVVLQDNQIPVTTQTGADIDHPPIGRRQDRVASLATDIQALVLDLIKAGQHGPNGGPDPGNLIVGSNRWCSSYRRSRGTGRCGRLRRGFVRCRRQWRQSGGWHRGHTTLGHCLGHGTRTGRRRDPQHLAYLDTVRVIEIVPACNISKRLPVV